MKAPVRQPRHRVGNGKIQDFKIARFPAPHPRQRDGLVGLCRELTAGELVSAAAELLEREASLRNDAGRPDPWVIDFAKWLRNGGRHVPH